jgi:arylsulfatase A-like enzyme
VVTRLARILVVVATMLAACDRGLGPTMIVEDVVEDLDRRRPDASDDGVRADVLTPGDALRGDGGRPSLVMAPGTAARFRLAVPERAVLRFAVGVQGDGRRDKTRSAIRFAVSVDGAPVFAREVNPAAARHDRRWFDEEVDLSAHRGREVELALATAAVDHDAAAAGTPGWSRVRLVQRTDVARQAADPSRPNVLVVVVDTLRADAVGTCGRTGSTTPALDALAARGLCFAQAVSQSAWTLPSVASLLTGLPPRMHGALGQDERDQSQEQARWGVLGDGPVTWAEVAAHAGVTTVGVSSNPLVSRGTNVAQGFETFVELPWDPDGHDWPAATDVNAAFLDWLRANRTHRFAGYLHYMEPHDPYTPPDPPAPPPGVRPAVARGWIHDIAKQVNWEHAPPLSPAEVAHLRDRYDGEVRAWDRALGALLAGLESLGVADRTIVIVTADHGEEFQEHGRLKHGSHLYEELVHVPLVLAGPGIPAGTRTDLVQGIDLFPTVAGILGATVPAGLAGHTLLSAAGERAVVIETAAGIGPDGKPIDLTSVRTSRWKLIETPALARVELYDLADDPHETRDRSDVASVRAVLSDRLAAWRAATPLTVGVADPSLGPKLQALGYVR